MINSFEQLYSSAQLAAFRKVQAALVSDPTALDNRGGTVASVEALNPSVNVKGTDDGTA